MSIAARRRVALAAWASLSVHAVAGADMLLVLRRGLATNPDLSDRMRFVAANAGVWRGAWLVWNFAALSILYLFAQMARVHEDDDERVEAWCRVAWALGVAAVVADLSAEALMMFGLPAAARAGDAARFLLVDRAAVLLTGCWANALYTLATVILAAATRRSYPVWTWGAGVAVGAAGAFLSWCALIGWVRGMFWANAALVPLVILWQLGVALRWSFPDRGSLA